MKPNSLTRELAILRHAFRTAKQSWDIPLTANVFAEVVSSKGGASRQRRLEPSERESLLRASQKSRNQYIRFLVELALKTAMRRGELLSVRWANVCFDKRTLLIPVTKNGHARTMPLTGGAVSLLGALKELSGRQHDHIIPISENSDRLAWKRLVKRAGVENLIFHDLRHEAISTFFERGLSVPEVALISGHWNARMLFRFTHPIAEKVAAKLT